MQMMCCKNLGIILISISACATFGEIDMSVSAFTVFCLNQLYVFREG